MIEPSTTTELHNAASLLGLDEYELKNGFTTRIMQPKGDDKSTIIRLVVFAPFYVQKIDVTSDEQELLRTICLGYL